MFLRTDQMIHLDSLETESSPPTKKIVTVPNSHPWKSSPQQTWIISPLKQTN